MIIFIIFLGLYGSSLSYDPIDAFGFIGPDISAQGQSCQFFKNGQFYRGPCQNKPDFSYGQVGPFGNGYQPGPVRKPPVKRGGGSISYPSEHGGYEKVDPEYGSDIKPSYGEEPNFGNKPGYGGVRPGGLRPSGGFGFPQPGNRPHQIKPGSNSGYGGGNYGKPGGFGQGEGNGYGGIKPEHGFGHNKKPQPKPETLPGGFEKPYGGGEGGYGRPDGFSKPGNGEYGQPDFGQNKKPKPGFGKPSILPGGFNKPNGGEGGYGQPDSGYNKKPQPDFGKPEILPGGFEKPDGNGYGQPGEFGLKPQPGFKPGGNGYGQSGFGNNKKPQPKPGISPGEFEKPFGGGDGGYGRPDGFSKPGNGGYGQPDFGHNKKPGFGKPGILPGGFKPNGGEGGYGQPGFEKPGFGKPNRGDGYNQIPSKPCSTNDGLQGFCAPLATCFYQFDDLNDLQENLCEKVSKLPTVCCPVEGHRESKIRKIPIKIPKEHHYKAEIPPISIDDIENAARESKKIVQNNLELEVQLVRKGFIQTPNSMESYHQAFFGGPDPLTRKTTKDGLIALETTIQLAKKFGLNKYEARDGLQQYSLYDTSIRDNCPKEPHCVRDKYRTIDGSCNNLEHPLWGKSHTSFIRIAPPDYSDGLNELRKASDGSNLPGARIVSSTLATDVDIPDVKFSLLVMQWGQFIDHDLTLTASTRIDSDRGEGIICCREEFARNPSIRHPACRPISLPHDDPFFSKFDHHCTNFVRNSPSPRPGCFLGPREQSNTLTHYIDGSMVYGSTVDRAAHLRAFVKGKLKNTIINGVEYLPFDAQNRSDECAIPAHRQLQCFVGGDVRVNEQTGLTTLHMLFLREHNRLADKLSYLNPSWNDETIYQEARRILAAVIQHITYNEWMPLIIGRRVMKEFNLMLKPSGYSFDYDPHLNGGILNSFATAAYRFHTLIQGVFKLMNNHGKITNKLLLRNLFNNPESIYQKGAFDEYLNCLTGQPTQTFDQFFSQELTNHLFQEHDREFGMDLISLNIQRGRDHGLPGYNEFRKACGLPPIRSFQELSVVMRQGSAERMSKIYKSVDDIDLFIAGNHEKALPGAVVGPTFSCILAEQARRSKLGDRFWYENGDMIHSFNKEQLDEIRKSSLAAIICANADNIEAMQPLALLQPFANNPKVPCNVIPQINLEYWTNEKLYRG
ncbi:chorion peroxidase isoform X2 [Tetranychus urticae]|uniref:chorion peroxidase isoform X2 n=1 Tax=Tetranychus urticae TaxID=32264 RepID=UPI000D64AE58|nr:chorion peroxidase isoform X2 [Tetranychus urticae]